MRKTLLSRKGLLTPAALALAAVLLSACSGAGTGPGVAATVGDKAITNAQVDAAADAVCTDYSQSERDAVALDPLRRIALQVLVDRALAESIAEEHDLAPSPRYFQSMAQARSQVQELPKDVRQAYLDLVAGSVLRSDIEVQLGIEAMGDAGPEGIDPQAAQQAGRDVFADWADTHGVEVAPRYGVAFEDGVLEPADSTLSVPVSDLAVGGLETDRLSEMDPAGFEAYLDTYVRQLPASQRCG